MSSSIQILPRNRIHGWFKWRPFKEGNTYREKGGIRAHRGREKCEETWPPTRGSHYLPEGHREKIVSSGVGRTWNHWNRGQRDILVGSPEMWCLRRKEAGEEISDLMPFHPAPIFDVCYWLKPTESSQQREWPYFLWLSKSQSTEQDKGEDRRDLDQNNTK